MPPVAFDADVLSLALNPSLDPPTDPTTNAPVLKAGERLVGLIADLEKTRTRVIIPAPALSEFLVIADESGPDYLAVIDRTWIFSIEPFDARAAVEAAAMTRKALLKGNKKSGATGTWQAVKADRQIVAIAKTRGVTRIYSNDHDMVNIAAESHIEVIPVWALPLPPEAQPKLPMDSPGDEPVSR
jgi:predicted nucleic acid-binding protein